jgi:hypothetical protein
VIISNPRPWPTQSTPPSNDPLVNIAIDKKL